MKKGKLIVIEGSDGSGKGTQTSLLKEYLEKSNHSVAVFSFPNYSSVFGQLIQKYQKGGFGPIENISPYIISLAYACDRALSRDQIKKAIELGKIVLANRYAYSNMAHQAARLPEAERWQFVDWDKSLEFEVNGLPREDLTMFLYVPFNFAQELMKKNSLKEMDLPEKDIKHLEESEKMYLQFSEKFANWIKIDCVKHTQLRGREDIHQEIVSILKSKGII